jgi:two-component system OmpR family response regulator
MTIDHEMPHAHELPRTARPGACRRILVVEDDVDIRRLNTEFLTQAGYRVDAAEDGAAAWETLQRASYDLVVTDNDMPNMTGVELLKMLRTSKTALPVIMASGVWPAEEFDRDLHIRPDVFLLKPYSFGDLLGAVRKVLHGASGACEQPARRPDV